jgi:tetratricopeptide (TPR) repeat protein
MAPQMPSARSGSAVSADQPLRNGVLRKEGEYWTVGYGGKDFLLKDSKGLGYLAHLLRYPGVEFHVLDLFGGIAGREEDDASPSMHGLPRSGEEETAGIHVGGLGDAGEMLDDQAKAAYRHRLAELREELDQAKELGNVTRAERAEQEIDALTRELSRAVGLGGRNRRAASASERARQSITKTIKAVVERIAQSDAALGDLFSRCIKTGTFCSYQPDPNFPIAWEFAATHLGSSNERTEPPTAGDDQAPPAPRSSAALGVSPFSLAERTAFVGRESERDAVRAAVDTALGGHGSIVMLAGGPGVGKSRLASEMAEYASRNGFRYFVGHCYERDEPFPFLPFAEIIESALAQAPSLDNFRQRVADNAAALAQVAPSLRRVFPDLPEPPDLPAQQRRRYLLQNIFELMARVARLQARLYILEDLQWADESSLSLLNHLAHRVSQFPIVVIGTYRDGYSDNNPALVRTLEELIRLGIRPLKLGGLSKDSVARMLNELSRRQPPENLVSAIFEESQGNPFFVEEVYRHLVEEGKVFDEAGQFLAEIKIDEVDVPENVRLIIGRRLQRFDDDEKRALAAAAVIGRSFSFQLLTAISRIDIDELFTVVEKAQQMGIIVASAEGPEKPFTFAHELVRQTLLAGISMPRKQQLHASVADAIERLDAVVNGSAGEISDHLLKAGSFADRKQLVRWLTRAGKAALDASAFEEARHSFETAISHQSATDQEARADLLDNLAIAELGLEHWDAALANLREALEIYVKLGEREMIGRSFSELADAYVWVGRSQEAAETARRGLSYLEGDVSRNRVHLLAVLGEAIAAAGELEPSYEALDEALTIASKLADPKLEARVVGARSIVNLHFFRLREAAADGFLSERLADLGTSPWQRALQLRILHQALLYLGRLEEAIKIVNELEPLAVKIGQAYSVALCLSTRTWAEFGKEPDLARLEAGFLEVSKSDQKVRFGFWEVLSEVQLTMLDFIRGNWTAALAHARASCWADPAMSSINGFGEGNLFRQLAYAGDRDSALGIFREKRDLLPRSGQHNARGSWSMLALMLEGLIMLGERAQAGRLYPLVHELIASGAVALWPISRLTQTIAGAAAGAAGQWAAAEDHFQLAMQQAESFPQRLEQAEIRRFHAMMLLDRAARGDRERARSLLGEALETYTRIGMPRHIQMTRALLG